MRRVALALAGMTALALACALPAAADEAGGGDAFDLNLRMEVTDVIDSDAPVHPVTVTVAGPEGEPVAGAKVTYLFVEPNPLYYIPPETNAPAGEYAAESAAYADLPRAQAGTMVLSGATVCDDSGSARVEGIVRGCDYLVEAQAGGYKSYSNTHTCKGTGSEQWTIAMERESGQGGGSGDGPDSGSGSVSPLPWLSMTGDELLPWLLAGVGAALVGVAAVVLASRRKKDGADA